MTSRTAAAWDLIRAADPMASTDVTGASQAPFAQDLLHRITADVPVLPDVDTDVLTLLDVEPNRVLAPRRHGLVTGLAAAVVVLLAAVTVVVVRRENPAAAPSAQQSSTATQTQTPSPSPSAHSQATAAGYAKALLAELPLPAGARRVYQPPIPELKQAARTGNGILDDRVAWWSVPGSFAAAVARMGKASARPDHWVSSVGSTGSAGARSNSWLIEVRDPGARFVSSINVTVAAHGATVGMAAQVDTYAITMRTPGQVIPASPDSAAFTFTESGQSSSSRAMVINGPRVDALVREINATPTFVVLVIVPCPAPRGSITVSFRLGSQRWVLNESIGSPLCNMPTLTGADHKSVILTPSTALVTEFLAAAGLPSNYFNH